MTKILILGGGFGGLYCAKKLEKIKLNSFDMVKKSFTEMHSFNF